MIKRLFSQVNKLIVAVILVFVIYLPAGAQAMEMPGLDSSIGGSTFRSPGAETTYYIKPDVITEMSCAKNDPCNFYTAWSHAISGDTLIFMGGTYTMADMGYSSIPGGLIAFGGKTLNLYGGWDGDPTPGVAPIMNPKTTILDGENLYRIITLSGSPNTSLIDGFTMTKGYAENAYNVECHAGGAVGVPACGGAIYVDGASPTIQNNMIINNVALNKDLRTGIGGGIYAYASPAIKILNNEIYFNSANSALYDGYGGAIYLNDCGSGSKITGNNFWYNRAALNPSIGRGATIALDHSVHILINRNYFIENNQDGMAGLQGTAIYAVESYSNILDNVFGDNVNGSVIYLFSSSTTIERNYLDNPDAFYGIEIFRGDAFVANNFISNHMYGNVMVRGSSDWYAAVSFYFNTLSINNSVTTDKGYIIGDYVNGTFSHGIVSNQTYGFSDAGFVNGSLNIDYNLMYNNDDDYDTFTGYVDHSFTGDPLFINPINGDYHIQYGSAARDKGPGYVVVIYDIDHHRRPNDTMGWSYPADLGADEYSLPRYLPFLKK